MYLLSILGTRLIYYEAAAFYFLSALGPAAFHLHWAWLLARMEAMDGLRGLSWENTKAQRTGSIRTGKNKQKRAKTKRWQTSRQAPANKYTQSPKQKVKPGGPRRKKTRKRKMFLLTNCKTFAFWRQITRGETNCLAPLRLLQTLNSSACGPHAFKVDKFAERSNALPLALTHIVLLSGIIALNPRWVDT